MAESKVQLVLSFGIHRKNKLIKTVDYSEESVTIGSGSDALLCIRGENISPLHAVFNIEDDGTVRLLDLGSEHGTRLNGELISNATVQTGDRVQIGGITLAVSANPLDDFDEDEATVVASHHSDPDPNNDEATQPGYADPDEPTPRGAPIKVNSPVHSSAPAPTLSEDFPVDDETADEEAEPVEDVVAFVMKAGTDADDNGENRKRGKVLEINQLWENVLLDTKHFAREGRPVTIGCSTGWKWNMLGVDMGWIPSPLRRVVGFVPPFWSEAVNEWRTDFYAPETVLSGNTDHELFQWEDDNYVATIPSTWDGFVDVGTKRYTFAQLVEQGKATLQGSDYKLVLTDDMRLMAGTDNLSFFSQMVYPGQRVIANMSDDVDYPFVGIFSVWAALGLLFGTLMATLEPPKRSTVAEIPDRFASLIMEEPEKQETEKKPDSNPDAGEGAKAKRAEGKVGKKDAKMDRAKGNKVEMAQQTLDRQIAENAGVLGALREGSELDGVFGSSGLSADIAGGIGGLIGAKGTQIGSGGLGSRGSGLGGGGTAEGLGGLGTKGIGTGSSGYGSGGGSFGTKSDGAISSVGGDPIILGGLEKKLIDEVIKRHMNQLRYCYQRELMKDHTLSGKIVVKFIIAKDGSVSSASIKSSTMSNGAVEQCLTNRFMRMNFPQPTGGGIVIVSYPLIFAPG